MTRGIVDGSSIGNSYASSKNTSFDKPDRINVCTVEMGAEEYKKYSFGEENHASKMAGNDTDQCRKEVSSD